MSDKITTLEELTSIAIKVNADTLIYSRSLMRIVQYCFDASKYRERTYYVDNDIVCFVFNKSVFVMPNLKGVTEILKSVGFFSRKMTVPFSNGDTPAGKKAKRRWTKLDKKYKAQIAF